MNQFWECAEEAKSENKDAGMGHIDNFMNMKKKVAFFLPKKTMVDFLRICPDKYVYIYLQMHNSVLLFRSSNCKTIQQLLVFCKWT